MAGNTTSNSSSLIRANIYSRMVQDPLRDELLDTSFAMDVSSEFPDGTTANFPLVGEAELNDRAENESLKFSPISSSNITMTISNHVSSAHYITLEQMEDSHLADKLTAEFAMKEVRAIRERFLTDLLNLQSSQTAANTNSINGVPHRTVASASNDVIGLEDFSNANYSLTKANVPDAARIAIVDPFVAQQLEQATNLVNVSNNPMYEGIITSGLMKNMRFVRNIYGFDVLVSNYLPTIASETISGDSVSNAKAALFMSVADDTVKPFAYAWRRMPATRVSFNEDRLREEYSTTARWGTLLYRPEGLHVCLGAVPSSGFSV